MVFSSPVFLFFFLPAVLALTALAPRGLRNAVLLLASLLFYAWGEPRAVLVLLVSIAVNYALGLALSGATPRRARGIVAAAVVFNVGLLALYKYAG
ncbi:MAG: MBOAT family protein, partial [Planctomycetota bacterium]